jgi:hypothetical protein
MPTTVPTPMYISASSPSREGRLCMHLSRPEEELTRKAHHVTNEPVNNPVMNRPGSDVTRERLARVRVSRVESAGEPVASLLARTVGPRLWIRGPRGVPVDPVVANCGSSP